MEQTYAILWCERKTTTNGKTKLDATLTAPDGSQVERVSIWADFPGFETLQNGGTVTGSLSPAKDPRFGPTLYPPRPTTAPRGNGAFKTHQMEKMAGDKREFIQHTMDAKDESIRISSCNNQGNVAATAIFEAEMRLHAHQDPFDLWQKTWDKCRNHMWMHWDEVKTGNPPTGI